MIEPSHLMIVSFIVVGIALPVISLSAGMILRPHKPSPEKQITYESGVDPTGDSWVKYNVRYYLFALLFVIFDVEAVFLYPWAAGYDTLRTEVGLFILVEMFIFVFFLILGLIYAWKKRVLEWN